MSIGDLVATAALPFLVGRLAFSPDGRWVAAGAYTGSPLPLADPSEASEVGGVALIDAATGAVRWRVDDLRTYAVTFSPNGRRVAVASVWRDHFGGPVLRSHTRVLEVDSGAEVWTHPGEVPQQLVYSPDGRLLAIIDDSGHVRLVDAESGRQNADLDLQTSTLSPAFSSDSRWLAVADSTQASVVDTATGSTRCTAPVSEVVRLMFTTDDRHVVAVSSDPSGVAVFDAVTGVLQTTAELEPRLAGLPFLRDTAYAVSLDRRWLIQGGTSAIAVFGVADGRLRFPVRPTARTYDARVAFSPNGRLIAVNSAEAHRGAMLLQAETGQNVWQAESDAVLDVVFSADGHRFALCSGGTVRVYDTGVVRLSQLQLQAPVTGVAVTGGGIRLVATTSGDRKASVFHADSGELLLEKVHPGVLTSIVFSPDGQCFVTGSTDGGVRLFATVSGSRLWLAEYSGAVNMIAFGPPDGASVAVAGADKLAHLLDRETGQERWRRPHPQSVTHISVSHDGQWVATGCTDLVTRCLSAATGEEIFRVQHDGRVRAIVFSPTASVLATGNEDDTVVLVDPAAGRELGRVLHTQPVTAVAISPDGSLLASGGNDKTVRFTDPASGEPALPALTLPARVTGLAFDPVDALLAVVTDDGLVRLIETAGGSEADRFVHPNPVRAIAFSPEGKLLATACDDDVARLFWRS